MEEDIFRAWVERRGQRLPLPPLSPPLPSSTAYITITRKKHLLHLETFVKSQARNVYHIQRKIATVGNKVNLSKKKSSCILGPKDFEIPKNFQLHPQIERISCRLPSSCVIATSTTHVWLSSYSYIKKYTDTNTQIQIQIYKYANTHIQIRKCKYQNTSTLLLLPPPPTRGCHPMANWPPGVISASPENRAKMKQPLSLNKNILVLMLILWYL